MCGWGRGMGWDGMGTCCPGGTSTLPPEMWAGGSPCFLSCNQKGVQTQLPGCQGTPGALVTHHPLGGVTSCPTNAPEGWGSVLKPLQLLPGSSSSCGTSKLCCSVSALQGTQCGTQDMVWTERRGSRGCVARNGPFSPLPADPALGLSTHIGW